MRKWDIERLPQTKQQLSGRAEVLWLSNLNSRFQCLYFIIIIIIIFLIYFIYGCVGSSFLCEGLLQLWQAGATLHRGARASCYRGLPCCGAQAPDAQAQQLWPTGPAAPRHVGSSQTRAWTRVPCIGRRTPNHCATREAPIIFLIHFFVLLFLAMLHGVWDLSSPTRDQTCAPCIGSAES